MITRTRTMRASALLAIVSLLPPALCHMELSWPYPLRSKYNPDTPEQSIDYNMMAPLDPSGSQFPCRGYQNDPSRTPSTTYEAGSTYNMTLEGSATHMGGSCQLSLSYDNGATFRVIKSMIGGCPLKEEYDFTIPSYAPAGSALFAWTWSNLVGNREFYMNCALITIQQSSVPRPRRRDFQSINDLPFVWKADQALVNDCATVEGVIPVYPHPGPDVEYGDGMTSSSPATVGDCDSPTPYGSTYEDTESSPAPDLSYNAGSSGEGITNDGVDAQLPAVSLPAQGKAMSQLVTADQPANTEVFALQVVPQRLGTTDLAPLQSTTTVTVDCADTVTITMYPTQYPPITTSMPPMYTTSSPPEACYGTSASCPCNPGYACRLIGTCTWACLADAADSTPTAFITSRTTLTAVNPTTTRPAPSPQPPPENNNPSPPTNNNRPPYVSTSDLAARLPCVPGSFICTSETTFYTCDVSSDSSWSYKYPRQVADGMMCLPNLSPYTSSTEQYRQQGQTVPGFYRDDRYVRARPDGDCDVNGSLLCTDGGAMFDVCDQGGWVRMGAVAAGTTCRDGRIEAS